MKRPASATRNAAATTCASAAGALLLVAVGVVLHQHSSPSSMHGMAARLVRLQEPLGSQNNSSGSSQGNAGAAWLMSSAGAEGGSSSNPTAEGIVCTVVKDETRHLVEWVQFHLLVGATKVVVYDDGSAVDPSELLRPFGESTVVHKVSELGPIPPSVYSDPERPFIQRMFWAYHHCGATYGAAAREGKQAAAGAAENSWLAVIDTDEYLFPCRRDVTPTIAEALQDRLNRSSIAGGALGAQVECLKFGFNDVNRSLTAGELQVELHTHRAPYDELEPHIVTWAKQHLTGCDFPKVCYNQGAYNQVYKLSVAAEAQPTIHEPMSQRVRQGLDRAWSRQHGLCCNHYMLRGTPAEMLEKASKTNFTDLYAPKLQPHPLLWYTSVGDTLIWQYLADFKAAMRQRGLM